MGRFQNGILEDEVIAMCAAYRAKDSGDERKSLDLRLEAGDVARESGSDIVTETHVQEARERVQTDQVVEGTQNYSQRGKFVLYARSHRDVPARGLLGKGKSGLGTVCP
jgi:cell division control protein 6